MATVYDTFGLNGVDLSMLAAGDTWQNTSGTLASLKEPVEITQVDPTRIQLMDQIAINGGTHAISGIRYITVDVTHDDGMGGLTVTPTPLIVLEYTEGSGETGTLAFLPDGAGDLTGITQIEITALDVTPADTRFQPSRSTTTTR
jgi:hypothetical protein